MVSDSYLYDLVNELPDACLKDANSGKYILANRTIAARYGLASPENMTGLTVGDFGFVQTPMGRAHAAQTREMDDWVRVKRQKATITRAVMLFAEQPLVYETVTKVPVLGERNLLGIITFAKDLTPGLPHKTLYALYKNILGSKLAAIQKLLQHFRSDDLFFTLPTESELYVLIERGVGRSNKEIAVERNVSIRTVDAHINNIRAKLKGDVLSKVIERLRSCNESMQTESA
jgi:hypothetical protein